ncbi:MAG: serine hydrolase domain-containing protein [Parvularculaceae bacterium]
MDFNRRVFLGGAAMAASAAAAAPSMAATSKAGGGKAHSKALKALDALVEQHRTDWGLPGMTVVVVDRDGFAGFVRAGWADVEQEIPVGPDHLFQIGSISKMFTALAAYTLIEEGRLSPDARMQDVLEGMSVRDGEAITLQQLLNHTAGLPADSSIFPQGGLWSGFSPGSNWSYSNAGYNLAGHMSAAVGGAPNFELVDARVLKKLGMTDSVSAMFVADRPRYAQGYEPALTDRLNLRPSKMTPTPWVDSDSPSGCVAATAGDMAIFLRFLLGVADGEGGAVFSDDTAKRFLADPAEGWGPGEHYGNGVARVEVDGRKYLHHTGGMVSFCSSLHVDPEAGVAAFASTNIHYAVGYRPRDITVYGCELLRAIREGGDAPAPKPSKPVIADAGKFKGVFTAADGDSFEVVAAGEALNVRRAGRTSPMQRARDALFATTEPDFAVTGVVFEAENDAAVRAWIGEKEYLVNPSTEYMPPAPEELRALAGRYDNDDRWAGPLYIYARAGGLWIGNAVPLVPLEGGEWRLGDDETSPERIRFDGFINGRAQQLLFSGAPHVRRFS